MALSAIFLEDDRFAPISLFAAYKKPSIAKEMAYDNCNNRVNQIREALEAATGCEVTMSAGIVAFNCMRFTYAAHFYVEVDYLDSYKDAKGVMHNFTRTGSVLYAEYNETATRRSIHFTNIAKDTTIATICYLMRFDEVGK